MNGRIQELSKQAYELQRHKHGGYFTQQLLLDAFAELIVRECGNYMNSRIPGNIEVSATVAKMKKHLGVEE